MTNLTLKTTRIPTRDRRRNGKTNGTKMKRTHHLLPVRQMSERVIQLTCQSKIH